MSSLDMFELKQHIEQHSTTDKRLDGHDHLITELAARMDRQESRLNWAIALAIVAAAGGGLFGLINFVLLLQLYGRLP